MVRIGWDLGREILIRCMPPPLLGGPWNDTRTLLRKKSKIWINSRNANSDMTSYHVTLGILDIDR